MSPVKNACDFRRTAWQRLCKGGWAVSVAGFACNFLGVAFAGSLAEGFLGALFRQAPAHVSLAAVLACMALGALALRFYMEALLRYGSAAMALAVMRGGASLGHAFSGRGRAWRTFGLMFLSTARILLGTLCFVVPGVRAFYAYRLVYFLRVDHPELSTGAVMRLSARLMAHRRWRLFCLDVSFLPWIVLGVCTFGMALFVVFPYMETAHAAFYEDILDEEEARGRRGAPAGEGCGSEKKEEEHVL